MNLMQLGWRAVMNDRPYVKELAGDFASLSALHVELFMVEARAEATRLKRRALLLFATAAAMAIAVVFFLAAIIAAFWDTDYRLYALFGVPSALVLVAFILYQLAAMQKSITPPFQQSAAEIKKDVDWVLDLL